MYFMGIGFMLRWQLNLYQDYYVQNSRKRLYII